MLFEKDRFQNFFWDESPEKVRLLQSLADGDSHCHGHADHGVVACAQEAHHLHGKSTFGGFRVEIARASAEVNLSFSAAKNPIIQELMGKIIIAIGYSHVKQIRTTF